MRLCVASLFEELGCKATAAGDDRLVAMETSDLGPLLLGAATDREDLRGGGGA